MKKTFILSVGFLFSFASAMAQFAFKPTPAPQASGDAWIKQAYQYFWSRDPLAFEYNKYNYNGGEWKSYDELQTYVAQFQKSLRDKGLVIKQSAQSFNGNVITVFEENGRPIAVDMVSLNNGTLVAQGGGNIVAQGGGNIVAQGGGNLVAQGGGNIVAQGGGNIVAQGGGNLNVRTDMKGVSFGSLYVTADASTKVIKASGKGALIIR